MSFLIMLGLTAVLVSTLITVRLTAQTTMPLWGRLIIGGVIALAFLSPFLFRDSRITAAGVGYKAATYAVYFVFLTVFLFFSFMIIRDIGWAVLRWMMPGHIPSPFQPTAVLKANIILLVCVFAVSVYALYEGTRVPDVKRVTIASAKIREPMTVAVLPDIHIHRALSEAKLRGIIERTNALKPDVIALPGDIIDDRGDQIRHLVPLLSQFKAPLGVYVTDGNHEIYTGTVAAQKQFAADGLIYLCNDYRFLTDTVRIAGVPDPQSARIGRPPVPEKAMPSVSDHVFTILLSHTPKTFDLPGNTADLQVSGHTHGGQIFPFHILAKLANKYLAGLYRAGNRTLYVSRGAGQWGPQMRFLSPSEITLITLVPEK